MTEKNEDFKNEEESLEVKDESIDSTSEEVESTEDSTESVQGNPEGDKLSEDVNLDSDNSVDESNELKDDEDDEGNKKKLWPWLIAILLIAVIGTSLYVFFNKDDIFQDPPSKPIPDGKLIILPDPMDAGKPNSEYVGNQPDPEGDKDKTAPTYVNPESIDNYRQVDDNGNAFLMSPVDGACSFNTEGNVLPPDNYMHSCYYEQNGAVMYTSHAVIGPRTGALENIKYLKEGQEVTLDGVTYVVSGVYVFPDDQLPEFLFKPGVIGLVTCHIDSSVKTFEDYTKTDIVTLEKKE